MPRSLTRLWCDFVFGFIIVTKIIKRRRREKKIVRKSQQVKGRRETGGWMIKIKKLILKKLKIKNEVKIY